MNEVGHDQRIVQEDPAMAQGLTAHQELARMTTPEYVRGEKKEPLSDPLIPLVTEKQIKAVALSAYNASRTGDMPDLDAMAKEIHALVQTEWETRSRNYVKLIEQLQDQLTLSRAATDAGLNAHDSMIEKYHASNAARDAKIERLNQALNSAQALSEAQDDLLTAHLDIAEAEGRASTLRTELVYLRVDAEKTADEVEQP